MASTHFFKRLCAALLAAGGIGGAAHAQAPKADTVLARLPAVPGVAVSTPAAADCKVEVREWEASKPGGVKPKGVIVTDAAGRKVRSFIDTNGGDKFNILSYYTDGVESFREIDTNADGKPDAFRWLGPNGGKQGRDEDQNGTIDSWTVIAAEEVAHEVFAAVKGNDPARLKAVFATESEIKALKLPPADEAKLLKKVEAAGAKLTKAAGDLKLGAKAKLVHVELDVPHTTPRDALGTAEDLVKHKNVGVLADPGDGTAMKFLSTGEMVQIGRAWRLVDGPSSGLTNDSSELAEGVIPEVLKEVVAKLVAVPQPKDAGDMSRYHLARAALLEQCVEKTKGAEQLPWLKQLIDSYAAAVEADPTNADAMKKFAGWHASIAEGGAAETKAYSAFRHSSAEYAVKLKAAGNAPAKIQEAQDWRRESLEAFVKAHPASTDAPEAVMQLAIAAEFGTAKDSEKVARGWYEKLVKDYAGQPHATKAAGAIRRLECEGKAFEMSGDTLDGKKFTEASVAGKTVVVVWWASWGTAAADDLKALAKLQAEYAAKGLVVVTVSVDDDAAKAAEAVRAAGLTGYHLHAAGGLDRSPLAAAYGVHGIPHAFVVGKDGKVVNRAAQMGADLAAEVAKQVK